MIRIGAFVLLTVIAVSLAGPLPTLVNGILVLVFVGVLLAQANITAVTDIVNFSLGQKPTIGTAPQGH